MLFYIGSKIRYVGANARGGVIFTVLGATKVGKGYTYTLAVPVHAQSVAGSVIKTIQVGDKNSTGNSGSLFIEHFEYANGVVHMMAIL
jgi:hypothetical protein